MEDPLEDVRYFVGPDTFVYTKRGPQRIAEIQAGDEVITRLGNLVPVARIHRQQYRGRLVSINGEGLYNAQHQILLEGDHFEHVVNLRPGHVMPVPIPGYEQDIVEISAADCLLYGAIIAAGRLGAGNRAILPDSVLTDCIVESLKSASIEYTKDAHTCELTFDNRLRRELFEDAEGHPRLHAPLLHLPLGKLTQLLRGLWDGRRTEADAEDDHAHFDDTRTAECVRYLLLRLGIDSARSDGTVTRRPGGSDKLIFRPVEDVSVEDFEGDLFDLETAGEGQDEQTYLTIGVSKNGGGESVTTCVTQTIPNRCDGFFTPSADCREKKRELRHLHRAMARRHL
jgi:hypothetical protein